MFEYNEIAITDGAALRRTTGNFAPHPPLPPGWVGRIVDRANHGPTLPEIVTSTTSPIAIATIAASPLPQSLPSRRRGPRAAAAATGLANGFFRRHRCGL